jgi:hypothetical protein
MLRGHATEPEPVAGLSVGAGLWVILTCSVMPKLPSGEVAVSPVGGTENMLLSIAPAGPITSVEDAATQRPPNV